MGTEKIKVSVIMPVYNAREYLTQAIESVLCQTMPDFELICVDDGSKDNSLDILNEYNLKDKRVIILSQKNSGAGVARNYAMSQANGEYVTFLDSDDLLEKCALEKLYSTAKFSNADVVISEVLSFDSDTETQRKPSWIRNQFIPVPDVFSPEDVIPFLFDITVAGPPGKLINAEFIKEHKLEYLTLKKSEDFCFIYSALYNSRRIAVVNEPLYAKRNNSASLENTKSNNPLVFYDAIKEFEKKLKADGVFDLYRQTFINCNVTRFGYNLKSIEHDKDSFNQVLELMVKISYPELGIGLYPATFYYDEQRYFYLLEVILDYWKNNNVEYSENIRKKLSAQLEKYKEEQRNLDFMKAKVVEARKLDAKVKNLEKMYSDIQNSLSFKIGRIITYIPRKIRSKVKK